MAQADRVREPLGGYPHVEVVPVARRPGVGNAGPMLLVTPAEIGTAAWHRMVRDATLVPLSLGAAMPADRALQGHAHTETALRALSLEWSLPRRAVVAGLAALWVRGYVPGAVRWRIDVAVPRGDHPDPPAGATPREWEWHSDTDACRGAGLIARVPIATPAHAAIGALRRADHGLAIPAVAAVLRHGECGWRELEGALAGHSRRGPGYDRMVSALAALKETNLGPVCALP